MEYYSALKRKSCKLWQHGWTLRAFILVQFSCSVVSDFLRPHGLQHARLPCPSPTPRACSNSCLLSQWCHPSISPSVLPFSSCLQSFPVPRSFQMSQFFTSCSQSMGASTSASVLPMNIQDWFPLGLTGLISSQSKGLSRVFSNTTAQTRWLGDQKSRMWRGQEGIILNEISQTEEDTLWSLLYLESKKPSKLPQTQRKRDWICGYQRWSLLLGRKAMTNLDSVLKSRDITLPTKVAIVKTVVFPGIMYRCESWTIKKAERWRMDVFELWWQRRLLRVLWTARRSNHSILKEINPEYPLEGLMLKLQYFGHLMQETTL